MTGVVHSSHLRRVYNARWAGPGGKPFDPLRFPFVAVCFYGLAWLFCGVIAIPLSLIPAIFSRIAAISVVDGKLVYRRDSAPSRRY